MVNIIVNQRLLAALDAGELDVPELGVAALRVQERLARLRERASVQAEPSPYLAFLLNQVAHRRTAVEAVAKRA